MDANVHIQSVAIGMADPQRDEKELAAALKELRAAQASKDQVWQARAARRVQQLRDKER